VGISKGKLGKKTLELLTQATRHQLEMGFDDIVVNGDRVREANHKLILSGKKNVMTEKYKSLKEHEEAIKDCNNCRLCEGRTNFVYGTGDPNADVMFIGEGPGREEDLKGEPFVGRAGQLLNKILAAIDFKREDVYIANVVKCRPPNNRDPQPDEMETCMPHLKEQIRLIKPKIICALGRIASHALLETSTPLGKLRQKWHKFEGIDFIVTYHPAALLRFQQYKKDCWEDVQMLRERYDEIKGD